MGGGVLSPVRACARPRGNARAGRDRDRPGTQYPLRRSSEADLAQHLSEEQLAGFVEKVYARR
ncbi:hypothetical protein AB0D97_16495 [Streptomyces roseus]|uniref:hypothetical protein n=1 Tax=Streptomyces roseus TaxID=66430 RepID=UPI0033F5C702